MLDYENQANPFDERREAIARWRAAASVDVAETAEILRDASTITRRGVRASDALHIACAIAARCAFFLTTEDNVVKKMRGFPGITVVDPTQFVIEVE